MLLHRLLAHVCYLRVALLTGNRVSCIVTSNWFCSLSVVFPMGQLALTSMSNGVSSLLGFADAGIASFSSVTFKLLMVSIFAIRVLPIIIFF
ncbi:hypothetical protein O9929_11620 [Vibrio lentus]|nr:hypothetical protein [Vibrio lentus]